MNKHKWHDEIKAWADGLEIQTKDEGNWYIDYDPAWNNDRYVFRIKPPELCKCQKQTCSALKEKKYLYIYERRGCETVELYINTPHIREPLQLFGKIEVQDD